MNKRRTFFTRIVSRFLCVTLAIVALVCVLSSCAVEPYSYGEGELEIVTSNFIPFDFARRITNGRAHITVLQTDGGDMHDFTPTTASLKALAKADIFICVGGASDELWMDDALSASGNAPVIIKLSELVDGRLAELEGHTHSEYCETNHTHEHSEHEHEHSVHDGHNHTADEHIWTSPENAITAVGAIAEVCIKADTANAELYGANAAAYIAELKELDENYKNVFSLSEKKTLVFADRFPFIHLTEEYGACYYAAFGGCGGEADADFETAVRLTQAVKDNDLKYILVTESSDGRLAKSISDSTGCSVLTIDSLQSVSLKRINEGITYLDVMKENLEVLKKALDVTPKP